MRTVRLRGTALIPAAAKGAGAAHDLRDDLSAELRARSQPSSAPGPPAGRSSAPADGRPRDAQRRARLRRQAAALPRGPPARPCPPARGEAAGAGMLLPYLSQHRGEHARPPAGTRRQGTSPDQDGGSGDPPAGRAPQGPRRPRPGEPPPQRSAAARRQRRSPRRHLPGNSRGAADIEPAPPPPVSGRRGAHAQRRARGHGAVSRSVRERNAPAPLRSATGRKAARKTGGDGSWQRGNAGRGAQSLTAATGAAGNAPGSRPLSPGPGSPLRMRGRGRTPVSSVSLKIALIEGLVRAPGAVAAPALSLSREGLSGPGWPAGSCGEGRRWQGSRVVLPQGGNRRRPCLCRRA